MLGKNSTDNVDRGFLKCMPAICRKLLDLPMDFVLLPFLLDLLLLFIDDSQIILEDFYTLTIVTHFLSQSIAKHE